VIGGIGVLGLVVGGATRLAAFGQKTTIDDHCRPDKSCDQTGMDAVSLAGTLQTVSTVSLVVGLAGLGTGFYLVLSNSGRSGTQATIHPVVVPAGAGLALRRSF